MNQALSVQIPSALKVLELDGAELSVPHVGVFPIQCCIAGSVRDPEYLSQNRDRHKDTNPRFAYVVFKPREPTSRAVEDFAANSCVSLAANKTPHSGEELYVSSGLVAVLMSRKHKKIFETMYVWSHLPQ